MSGVATAIAIGGGAVLGAGASIYGSDQARKSANQQASAARDAQAQNLEWQQQAAAKNEDVWNNYLPKYTSAIQVGANQASPYFTQGMSQNASLAQTGADTNASSLATGANKNAMIQGGALGMAYGNMNPYIQAGASAVGKMNNLTPDQIMQQDPGYQFRLDQGNQQINRQAAAGGRWGAAGTGAALAKYGQDYASNEYGNVYNRLYGQAQMGQQAAGDVSGYGMASAGNVGNAYFQAGAGTGQGYMSAADRAGAGYMQGNTNLGNLYMSQGQLLGQGNLTAANAIGQGYTGAYNNIGQGALGMAGQIGQGALNAGLAQSAGMSNLGQSVDNGLNNYMFYQYLNNNNGGGSYDPSYANTDYYTTLAE